MSVESCTPLKLHDLRLRDRIMRNLVQGVRVGLAASMGPTLPFERMLSRGLGMGQRQERGFFVGVPFALAHFGDDLLLDLPTTKIDRRLVDLIRCGRQTLHVSDYFLGLGDWHLLSNSVMKSSVAAEAIELAKHGLDYRETVAYRRYLARAKAGRAVTRNRIRLDSGAQIDGYFERFVALFRSIESRGLLRLEAARRNAPEISGSSVVRHWATEVSERELGVAIGPAGEYYRLPGGQHRTAIAMILGLKTIPVQIRLVHSEWVLAAMQRHRRGAAASVRMAMREIQATCANGTRSRD